MFLNRAGGGYSHGLDDPSRNVAVAIHEDVVAPAFTGSSALWDEVLACVREGVAGFDIAIVDVDPGATPHSEVLVSGATGPEVLQRLRQSGVMLLTKPVAPAKLRALLAMRPAG